MLNDGHRVWHLVCLMVVGTVCLIVLGWGTINAFQALGLAPPPPADIPDTYYITNEHDYHYEWPSL